MVGLKIIVLTIFGTFFMYLLSLIAVGVFIALVDIAADIERRVSGDGIKEVPEDEG